jgi:phosphohistidine phosphatase SixA/8-oxo-dGTP pyrophosphatase MutT (NUDIX family)
MVRETDTPLIQAAGAVLWRKSENSQLEIAIIHRPRYDDWSLPKGKVENNESHIATAYREVLEETGYTSTFGPEIGNVIYKLEGAPKEVRYWAAQANATQEGKPNPEEVDQLEWVSPKDAKERLTNNDDRKIVDYFLEFGTDTFPIVLLRHAKALKRTDWDGDDGDRPLEHKGQLQAKRLLPIYLAYGVKEVHTSDALRCIETIEPMTRAMEMTPIFSADLSEYGYEKDKEVSLDYIQDLMDRGNPAIVCSHNPIIPKLVKKLVGKKYFESMDRALEPAQAIVLHCREGEVIACDWIDEPIL